jgi:hypothetical protein
MEEILTRCGHRCDLCLAYQANIEANPANHQILSDGWHKYFGFRIPAEAIICDGCLGDGRRLIDKSCPVRPCVIAKGLGNCSECHEYPCDRLADLLVVYEQLVSKHPCPIPLEDRVRFITPYENKQQLDRLRRVREADAG